MAKTVLIVDDDPDFLELMNAVLTPEGYEVRPCQSAIEAHRTATRLHPDVILIDLVMPEFSGWQIMEQLKSDPSTRCIPTIICTAAAPQMMTQVPGPRPLGSEILLKPFELQDLLSLLARMTAKRKAC